MDAEAQLSRRERQIMDIVYARGKATAGDVLEGLPDQPTRTTVRTLLRILETKGFLKHRGAGICLSTNAGQSEGGAVRLESRGGYVLRRLRGAGDGQLPRESKSTSIQGRLGSSISTDRGSAETQG